MSDIRRSSRANKGTHLGRDTMDVYYKPENEEPATKRARTEDPRFESEEGQVRCDPCNTNKDNYDEETDQGGTMIECDQCNTWQHAACMGYTTKKQIPETYYCNRCLPPSYDSDHDSDPEPVQAKPAKPPKAAPVASKAPKRTAPVKTTSDKTRTSVATALEKVMKTSDIAGAETWAAQLEQALFAWAGDLGKRYIDKSRSVMALMKKTAVLARLVSAELSAEDMVRLPVEEIDPDLKNYAEKIRQELIRRSVLTVDDDSSQRIRRTHKGEEIVESSDAPIDEAVLVARNIDHRKFKENTPPSTIIQSSNPVALYQLDDDDDEPKAEPKPEDDQSEPPADNESDDELDLILGKNVEPEPPAKSQARQPELPPTMPTKFWHGEINFPDVAVLRTEAEFAGCTKYQQPRDNTTASFHNRAMRVCNELLERSLYQIEGRLDLARAEPYLAQVAASKDFYLVQLHRQDQGYDTVLEYLRSRSKVGVLSNRPAFVKDAYLMALGDVAPHYIDFAHPGPGLYVLFVARKDYVAVGKSILKKSSEPAPRQHQQHQAPYPAQSQNQQHYQQPPYHNTYQAQSSLNLILLKLDPTGLPPNPTQHLSLDQVNHLSNVAHNPHSNPQALLDLLLKMQ